MKHQFYDDIPLSVCVLRRDRKLMDILFVNQAMAAMVGFKSPQDLIGQAFKDAWPDKDADILVKKLQSTTPPKGFTLHIPESTNHEKRWVNLAITDGQWDGQEAFFLWGTDVSASREEQERLQAEVEKADAMAEMKSNFLATMSHEIRTPMQTIYGLLELIADEKPDAKIATMVRTAQGSASGLLEILDDILDLAKMDANKMELDVFEVPVRLLVRGTLEGLSVKVHGVNIKLVDDIEKDVPFVIIGDPKRLRQIIMNLTGNALKFTHEGAVTVRVSAKTKHIDIANNQLGLRFEVIDTGIGMSAEACARLFQSFNQADNSTARKYGGTGLGLSISKKLVELMGGQIGVFSEPGKGSTFWFEIPTEEVGTDTTTVELPKLDGISVISVEDHPQGAKEIVNSLRSMGAVVESCPTYAEGLALIKRRPFDVAVIDQGLPDGLGLDLIKEAIDIRPFMGTIMYTVRDDVGLAHSLQALGVTYLTKPASRAGLGEAVKDAASKISGISSDAPKRLLIAEDTASIRDVLSRQLEKIGIDADFVHDGRQALSALETGKYGLLITDLHMPEVDGYQLVETVRKSEAGTGKHFPIMVLTADVQMAQRDTYLRHGFDECLLKPVSLGQFRRLLIRWGLLTESAASGQSAAKEDGQTAADSALPPAIDKDAMIEQMGAFDDSVIEMLHMFIDMTQPLIDQLNSAQEHKDFHRLAETAHSLKGAARSACCNVLGDIASRIQDDAEKQKAVDQDVAALNAEFIRVCAEIKALKSS
jgi:signal transduction histidine kinase/CheY-like chemotaxis protein